MTVVVGKINANRVLAANTLGFALAFAAWVSLGPGARMILTSLNLPLSWAPIVKAIPILSGSLLRIPLGILADRVGARSLFTCLLLSTAGACLFLSQTSSLAGLIWGALWLGLVGTTFTVGAQSVSNWTVPRRQGFALGVFGAGNVGTALTTLFFPIVAAHCGWSAAFQSYAAVLVVAGLAYVAVVPDAPRHSSSLTLRQLLAPLRSRAVWRLGLYYMASFGSFVGVTLMAGDLYIDSYGVDLVTSGLLATTFTLTCSLARISGGMLSDRLGAAPVLRRSLFCSGAFLLPVLGGIGPAPAVLLIFLAGLAMGVAMAAVMREVWIGFAGTMGAAGGVVGCLGGLAGFFLPQLGAALKGLVGNPFLQLLPVVLLIAAALTVHLLSRESGRAAHHSPALAGIGSAKELAI